MAAESRVAPPQTGTSLHPTEDFRLKNYCLLLLAGLCLIAQPALAEPENGRTQMQHFLSNLSTWQAHFEQTMLNSEQNDSVLYRGKLSVLRPGRFRWDYSEPEERLIIADGEHIWLLENDLEQVTVASQKKILQGTPAQFLIDDEPLEKSFDIVDIGSKRGLQWVELLPKKQEAEFRRIIIGFAHNQLQQMEMFDQYGQATRISFRQGVKNKPLAASLFEYEPPDGFDVFSR